MTGLTGLCFFLLWCGFLVCLIVPFFRAVNCLDDRASLGNFSLFFSACCFHFPSFFASKFADIPSSGLCAALFLDIHILGLSPLASVALEPLPDQSFHPEPELVRALSLDLSLNPKIPQPGST